MSSGLKSTLQKFTAAPRDEVRAPTGAYLITRPASLCQSRRYPVGDKLAPGGRKMSARVIRLEHRELVRNLDEKFVIQLARRLIRIVRNAESTGTSRNRVPAVDRPEHERPQHEISTGAPRVKIV